MKLRTRLDLRALSTLSRCASQEALTDAVDRIVTRLGIDYWFYAVDLPLVSEGPSQVRMGTYPEDWVRHYFEMDYLQIDPIISHCHDHSIPLSWHDAMGARRRVADPQILKIRAMFGEAREFGLRNGVSVPLHGPGTGWGLMSFSSSYLSANDFDLLQAELHLLAHFTHEAARRFSYSKTPTELPTLTRRERECLSWAAEGKTSWEIGHLLNISERTSIFHLQNAMQKLGVSGRQAAIARAVSLGLVVSIRS
jgi:DNA-binding CsgD family transcriptional regulator